MGLKLAILGSGNGSNFQSLVEKIKTTKIFDAEVKLLFCNKSKALILKRAKDLKIKSYNFSPKSCGSREIYDQKLLELLIKNDIDYVILAGYMLLLPPAFIKQYNEKIINIHPSLLPKFKGINAIEKAYNSTDKKTGVTVHYVNSKMDEGEVIIQQEVKIDRLNETVEELENKIHKVEHEIFFEALTIVFKNK